MKCIVKLSGKKQRRLARDTSEVVLALVAALKKEYDLCPTCMLYNLQLAAFELFKSLPERSALEADEAIKTTMAVVSTVYHSEIEMINVRDLEKPKPGEIN